jgi:hypothetical protein
VNKSKNVTELFRFADKTESKENELVFNFNQISLIYVWLKSSSLLSGSNVVKKAGAFFVHFIVLYSWMVRLIVKGQ